MEILPYLLWSDSAPSYHRIRLSSAYSYKFAGSEARQLTWAEVVPTYNASPGTTRNLPAYRELVENLDTWS
jgi:hypothetical protein